MHKHMNVCQLNFKNSLVVTEYKLDKNEAIASAINLKFKEDDKEYFAIGTALVNPNEIEPTKGKIIIFEVINSKLIVVSQKDVLGGVLCLVFHFLSHREGIFQRKTFSGSQSTNSIVQMCFK
jgi:hypothetical protein